MMFVVGFLVVVTLALWLWVIRQMNKVQALECEIDSLEGKLRSSRATSHQLALSLGAAKRQHPELRLDPWAEVRAEEARAEEGKKASD